jgi:magnesium transporter
MKMRKIIRKRGKKAGLSPGTLVHIGEKRETGAKLEGLTFNSSVIEDLDLRSADDIPSLPADRIMWIQIDGLHDIELIEKVGKHFNLHPLLLEDILNSDQRPKLEDYGDYLFIVFKMLSYDDNAGGVKSDQVALVLSDTYVLSFHENEKGIFNPIRERLQRPSGRIRNMGADYLVYALMDAIIDNYFTIFEKLGEHVESLEQEILYQPSTSSIHSVNFIKRELIFLRRTIWPLREVVAVLERRESRLIKPSTAVFLRDIYDHTIQIIENIESLRDILTGMLDIYLSSISVKTNDVIKVLTIIATIFIPLTFIVGIYGMNFHYMPELSWKMGYPAVMLFMFAVVAVMLYYFRKKKWI